MQKTVFRNGQIYRFPEGATQEQIESFLNTLEDPNAQAIKTIDGQLDQYGNRTKVAIDSDRYYDLQRDDYVDNAGMFSWLQDMRNVTQLNWKARELYDTLNQVPDDDPERSIITAELIKTKALADAYADTPDDNFLTTFGKQAIPAIAGQVAIGAGAAAGTAATGVGAPFAPFVGLGAFVGAGAYENKNQMEVENAIREASFDGDITRKDQKDATRTAYYQAGLLAVADSVGAGTLAKAAVKKGVGREIGEIVAKSAALGGGASVGVQMLQRGYIPELETWDEDAFKEYTEAFFTGALFDAATGVGFYGLNKFTNAGDIQQRALDSENEISPAEAANRVFRAEPREYMPDPENYYLEGPEKRQALEDLRELKQRDYPALPPVFGLGDEAPIAGRSESPSVFTSFDPLGRRTTEETIKPTISKLSKDVSNAKRRLNTQLKKVKVLTEEIEGTKLKGLTSEEYNRATLRQQKAVEERAIAQDAADTLQKEIQQKTKNLDTLRGETSIGRYGLKAPDGKRPDPEKLGSTWRGYDEDALFKVFKPTPAARSWVKSSGYQKKLSDYNAKRTPEGAQMQAQLSSAFNAPEQWLIFANLPESRIREIYKKPSVQKILQNKERINSETLRKELDKIYDSDLTKSAGSKESFDRAVKKVFDSKKIDYPQDLFKNVSEPKPVVAPVKKPLDKAFTDLKSVTPDKLTPQQVTKANKTSKNTAQVPKGVVTPQTTVQAPLDLQKTPPPPPSPKSAAPQGTPPQGTPPQGTPPQGTSAGKRKILSADSWVNAAKKLGVKNSSDTYSVIRKAQSYGYSGIKIKAANGSSQFVWRAKKNQTPKPQRPISQGPVNQSALLANVRRLATNSNVDDIVDAFINSVDLKDTIVAPKDTPTSSIRKLASRIVSYNHKSNTDPTVRVVSDWWRDATQKRVMAQKVHDAVAAHVLKTLEGPRFDKAHQVLDFLDQNSGWLGPDGQWRYKTSDKNGDAVTFKLNKNLSDDVSTLQAFYQLQLRMAVGVAERKKDIIVDRTVKSKEYQSASPAEAQQLLLDNTQKLDTQIKQLTSYLDRAYVPHQRRGEYLIKIIPPGVDPDDAHIYSIRSGQLANKKYKLAGSHTIDAKSWADLRQRVIKETGVQLPVEPNSTMFTMDKADPTVSGMIFEKSNPGIFGDGNTTLFDSIVSNKEQRDFLQRKLDMTPAEIEAVLNKGKNTQDPAARGYERMTRPRKNIKGYDNNWADVFENHRAYASNNVVDYAHHDNLTNVVANISRDRGSDGYRLFENLVKNEDNFGDNAARLGSFFALAGNLSTAAVQAATPFTTSVLVASVITNNPVKIGNALKHSSGVSAKVMAQYLRDPNVLYDKQKLTSILGNTQDAQDLISSVHLIVENPRADFNPQFTDDLAGTISNKINRVEDIAYLPLTSAETTFRLTSYFMFNHLLRDSKVLNRVVNELKGLDGIGASFERKGTRSDKAIAVEYFIDNAHAVFGKIGRNAITGSTFGRIVLPFSTYAVKALETTVEHFVNGGGYKSPEARARARLGAVGMVTAMVGALGLSGIPMFDLLEDMYAFFTRLLGSKKDLKDGVLKGLSDMGVDPAMIRLLDAGAVSQITGADVSQRMNISNPYGSITSLFLDDRYSLNSTGFLLPKLKAMSEAASVMDGGRFLKELMPSAIGNIFKAFDYNTQGAATNRGVEILDSSEINVYEDGLRLLGFEPYVVSRHKQSYYSALGVDTSTTVAYKRAKERISALIKERAENPSSATDVNAAINEELAAIADVYRNKGKVWDKNSATGLVKEAHRILLNRQTGAATDGKAAGLSNAATAEMQRLNRATGVSE